MTDTNSMARTVTIGHYVATVTQELEPLDTDTDRLMRMVRTIGDLSFVVQSGTQDLVDVLGVVSAEAQSWMQQLLAERAR